MKIRKLMYFRQQLIRGFQSAHKTGLLNNFAEKTTENDRKGERDGKQLRECNVMRIREN